ncbi:unnamed protein product [Musa textilis]
MKISLTCICNSNMLKLPPSSVVRNIFLFPFGMKKVSVCYISLVNCCLFAFFHILYYFKSTYMLNQNISLPFCHGQNCKLLVRCNAYVCPCPFWLVVTCKTCKGLAKGKMPHLSEFASYCRHVHKACVECLLVLEFGL